MTCSLDNPYIPQKVKILEYHRETPDNFSITIDFKTKHDPGQFVQVSLPGIGESPISICSYSDEYMKLNIREVGSVTHKISTLKEGDEIYIRGPYGNGYPMIDLKGNNILLIGGGCGVAPLKGIINYIEQYRKDYKDIDLFFAYRSTKDILFQRENNHWKQQFNLNLHIDHKEEEHQDNACIVAKHGFITDELHKIDISPKNRVVFLCGPPAMMDKVIEILRSKGFHEDQIFISAERLMQCAVGICGHCMIRGKYTCKDGPVFRLDQMEKENHGR